MAFFALVKLNFESLVGVWVLLGEQDLAQDPILCLPAGLGAGDTLKVQDTA